MAGDEEAPLVPADEKPRGDEAPPPPTDSERPTSAGIETDAAEAAAAAKESSSGAAPAVESDGRSFSQLLAGAMTSPVANPRAPPILTVPVVAVPCLLAPASMIESPGFPSCYMSMQGQFAMTHQAVLAAVTAQAQMQIQAAYPPSETVTNSFPHPVIPTVSPVPLHQVSPVPETYPDDVYHWRKYGQKQVKNTENSRSYYRCAVSDCLAKKKVECSPDGKIREVIYRSKHIHDPPQKHRHSREKESQAVGPSGENEIIEHPGVEPKESDPGKTNNLSGKELPGQQLYNSSECKEDAGIATKNNLAKEPYPKRRLGEISKIPSTPTAKAVREYIVQTEIDARHLSDGYRWRKYGQKMVKGNPNPRSYYRCTHDGCPVRKHVERASHDAKALVITYEGEHNHDQPMPKYVGEQPASDGPASATDKELNTSTSLSDKNSAQELNLTDVTKELSTDKTSEFGGEKAMKSVHSTTSIEVNERTNTEGVITTLLDKNPSPVSVKNA